MSDHINIQIDFEVSYTRVRSTNDEKTIDSIWNDDYNISKYRSEGQVLMLRGHILFDNGDDAVDRVKKVLDDLTERVCRVPPFMCDYSVNVSVG